MEVEVQTADGSTVVVSSEQLAQWGVSLGGGKATPFPFEIAKPSKNYGDETEDKIEEQCDTNDKGRFCFC